ncbi:putative ATP-dependent RNA helicase kurz [Faustovirus]|nr:putative ATP-dependent RNA helicase kurz [Faustovirus]
MSKPTLFSVGKLRAPNQDPKWQAELDEQIPVKYATNWFSLRQDKTGMENRVLIFKAETASGKSTAFPPELFLSQILHGDYNMRPVGVPGIICTQPRTLTAIKNVIQILTSSGPEYPKFLKLGESIGWSTKFDKIRPRTYGILYATIGTLQMQLKTYTDEEVMSRYRYILIDETHERDLQTDTTIYMLKNLLLRNAGNPRCPFVVLMSATFNPQHYLDYFGVAKDTNYIHVEGRTFEIKEHWGWMKANNITAVKYPELATEAVKVIIRNGESDPSDQSDILIFMPGEGEIKETTRCLHKYNEQLYAETGRAIIIVAVSSKSMGEAGGLETPFLPLDQLSVEISGVKVKPIRKVIISTNVAETGLTIDTLKYVIDCGYNREKEFNPNYAISTLLTKPAPQSRIRQRKGRAGRKFPGEFYPLYEQDIYAQLPEQQFPQIFIEDVTDILLTVATEQAKMRILSAAKGTGETPVITSADRLTFNVAKIDMLDPPAADSLQLALERCYSAGYIAPNRDSSDAAEYPIEITDLGRFVNEVNLPLLHTRMILAGFAFECSVLDLITGSAFVQIGLRDFMVKFEPINWKKIYACALPTKFSNENSFYRSRLILGDSFIDGVCMYLAICKQMSKVSSVNSYSQLVKWCGENNVQFKTVMIWLKMRDEMIDQLLQSDVDVFKYENNALRNTSEEHLTNYVTRFKYCVYEGFKCNLLTYDGNKYRTLAGLKISVKDLLSDAPREFGARKVSVSANPKYIVYAALSADRVQRDNYYDATAASYSVMDGYVNVDPRFNV